MQMYFYIHSRSVSKDQPFVLVSLSPCRHLSCYENAPDLKAHRLMTQPAAVQQCSYSQPSDSKLLLSFLTTPCVLSHLQNEPCWKFHYKLPCVCSIPWEKKTPYSLQRLQ